MNVAIRPYPALTPEPGTSLDRLLHMHGRDGRHRHRWGRRIAEADLRALRWVLDQHHHTPPLDRTLTVLSRAADHSMLWFAAAGLMAASGRPRLRRAAVRGTLAIALASPLANLAGKELTRRVRPPADLVPAWRHTRRMPRSASFPSGHSASAAAFATGVALEAPAAIAVPAGLLAAVIAYSRVYHGVHYPGDVLGGVLLGVAMGLATRQSWPVRAQEAATQVLRGPSPALAPDPDGSGLVAVVNTVAGRPAGIVETLRTGLPAAEIIEVGADDDLAEALEEAAVRPETRVLGVAGGDGTVNAGAQVALRHHIPLLVIPAGTLDHFARALGLQSVADAVEAYQAGEIVPVDAGRAGDDLFLNTASFGAYPTLVKERERLEGRIGKWPALALAMVRVLHHVEATEAVVDGRRRRLWLAFVGNCRYRPSGFAPSWRPRLDDGLLDVRLVDASHPYARTRLVAAVLTGRLGRCRAYEERRTGGLIVESVREPLHLARDGEVDGTGGLERIVFAKHPTALLVYRRPAAEPRAWRRLSARLLSLAPTRE